MGTYTLKIVIIALLLFCIAPDAPACAASTAVSKIEDFPKVTSRKWTSKYDQYFRKYTKRYFGAGFEWKWFKAQAIAESNLKASAQSWVNAKGIMQLMPKTFHEIKKGNPSFADINEPRWNIAAGIYYDRKLYKKWRAERPFKDKISFTFASYNAGFQNIVKAQKTAKKHGLNENLWHNIKSVAPKVSGWRHNETVGYVDKITIMMK
jgi:soluble lytic murein transglycosylase-like protein